jgi:Fic-DOC domain mobile mystery protein B
MSATGGEHLEPVDKGQTPLDPDEARGLIPSWIATRSDLNVAEEENVTAGLAWGRKVFARRNVLTQDFLRSLHKRMFGTVWKWAGRYRGTEKNIGVAPSAIGSELKNLFDDAQAWHEFDTYPLDERAARLHHRLTWIHPFPNGNGRCARVFADLYLAKNGADEFTWGASLPRDMQRPQYLAAIRAADARDYGSLLDFLRRDV